MCTFIYKNTAVQIITSILHSLKIPKDTYSSNSTEKLWHTS